MWSSGSKPLLATGPFHDWLDAWRHEFATRKRSSRTTCPNDNPIARHFDEPRTTNHGDANGALAGQDLHS